MNGEGEDRITADRIRASDRRPARGGLRQAAALALGLLVLSAAARAGEVRHFRAQDRESFLAGEMDGISVDPLGRLQLADRAERLSSLEEPFLFAAAVLPDGYVVGTGNAGRVLKIDRAGKVQTLFEAPEPEVFAVWADADGTVFAGTSPNGKVYRITAAGGEPFFDPQESYIWALARDSAGRLLVATGSEGRIYRVGADGQGELFYDGDDTHIRALAALPDGGLLAGTADEGLVLRIAEDGTVRTLYDAAQPEVVALVSAPGGATFAAVVASEASLIPPPANDAGDGAAQPDMATGAEAAVTVSEGAAPPPRRPSRLAAIAAAGSAKRSEILRIGGDGLVESIATFTDETVYALLAYGGRLWIGTGQEGKLFSRPLEAAGGAGESLQMVLVKDVDERQVVALLPPVAGSPAGGLAFATTNAAGLFRFTGGSERRGSYTSPALDAGQIARFGTLHWDGELPAGAEVEFAFRSGISSEPDATWSDWTPARGGREVAISGVPDGRYVQWRASLASKGGASPRLHGVELSYRQQNLRPAITSLTVLDPGEVLVPASFNPGNQVYEPAYPNRDGIFTTLQEGVERPEDRRQKTLWKRGFRSLRWEAEDPNGDALSYSLEFRKLGSERWLPVAEQLSDNYLSFDATVLPDGVYRFRLTASDAARSGSDVAPAEGLTAQRISEPVAVDHTEPALERRQRSGDRVTVTVTDAGSPLREAVVSVDAGPWRPVVPQDGLLDGRRETLELDVPAGSGLLLLRVTDAAFNIATFDLSEGE
jgi:hypothetical protein